MTTQEVVLILGVLVLFMGSVSATLSFMDGVLDVFWKLKKSNARASALYQVESEYKVDELRYDLQVAFTAKKNLSAEPKK